MLDLLNTYGSAVLLVGAISLFAFACLRSLAGIAAPDQEG